MKKPARKEESMRIRLTRAEKAAWGAAATQDGRTVSNWLRLLANRACGRTLRLVVNNDVVKKEKS
jgi:hypothetical protein